MDKIGPLRIEAVEIEPLKERELLQHHRALAPGAGLADGVAAIVVGQRRLDVRLPARHVVGPQYAAMTLTADVHDLLRAAEAIDRLRHETLRPGAASLCDLPLAV